MARKKLPSTLAKRSVCPIATALDLVGDKWSLLLIRDIGLFDKHRNKDFQRGAEGIPSNILASRLKHLVEFGVLEKRLYEAHPPRYEYHLTAAGKDLVPVVKSLAAWSASNVRGISIPSKLRQ